MKRSFVLAGTAVWVSLLAGRDVAYAQDPVQDCVVSKNGVCLDATLGNSSSTSTAEIEVPKPAPVIFKDGSLSITSDNSSLRDILTAVGSQTGVEMELPAMGLEERVVTHLGPGPMRDVLVELLNGSSFNYVMLASPRDPAVLQRLVMTNRNDVPGAVAAAVPPPPPSDDAPVPALYGQGFSVDPNDAAQAEAEAAQPAREEWAQKQGKLLDQMQKQRIKEEEQQQQQQQANPPPQ
jgi:hypothetical protein